MEGGCVCVCVGGVTNVQGQACGFICQLRACIYKYDTLSGSTDKKIFLNSHANAIWNHYRSQGVSAEFHCFQAIYIDVLIYSHFTEFGLLQMKWKLQPPRQSGKSTNTYSIDLQKMQNNIITMVYQCFFLPIGTGTGTHSIGKNGGKIEQSGNLLPLYLQSI
jgi:hypothetical protein